MISYELCFARLYAKYAKIYRNSQFWQKLSAEEEDHAIWLKTLASSSEMINISKNFLSATALEMLVETVEAEIKNEDELSVDEALKLALKFERSFAENHFFEVFTFDSYRTRELMEKLAAETAGHIERIKTELKHYD